MGYEHDSTTVLGVMPQIEEQFLQLLTIAGVQGAKGLVQ